LTDGILGSICLVEGRICALGNVRTAISIPESLLERIDEYAKKVQISRSRLFVLAVQDYLRQAENEELLQAINDAYQDAPSPEEEIHHRAIKSKHRQHVEGQW
jgi:metal-responsive CopG/Arc/MetJ family transcriptional regulator